MADHSALAVEAIRASALGAIPHGFMSRRGGVSTGALSGLNCGPGSGGDPADISANRKRVIEAVAPGSRLVTVYQVHSPDCVVVRQPWSEEERPEADAMVTGRPGLLLGILTADCAPVLLADRDAGVVAAAHAGWKGAFAGVAERTLQAMESLGASASRITAAVGPCIAQTSYEVDTGFFERFVAADDANAEFFAAGAPGHWQFDLEGFVASRLASLGIAEVERLGLDTYAAPDRFYSYRRATHLNEPSYGRQISVVGLPNAS